MADASAAPADAVAPTAEHQEGKVVAESPNKKVHFFSAPIVSFSLAN